MKNYQYSNRTSGFTPPLRAGAGFTLIELLIVSALLAAISLALYATFASGIKIWQRVNQAIGDEDVNIFFSKFTQEVSNSLRFAGLNFSGGSEQLQFATLTYSPQLEMRTVGQIAYAYETGIVNRKERDFSQVYNEQEGMSKPILKNLASCKFAYYIYDKETKEYLWKDESGQEESLPLAVKIELEYKDERGSRRFSRTVNIPIGG